MILVHESHVEQQGHGGRFMSRISRSAVIDEHWLLTQKMDYVNMMSHLTLLNLNVLIREKLV